MPFKFMAALFLDADRLVDANVTLAIAGGAEVEDDRFLGGARGIVGTPSLLACARWIEAGRRGRAPSWVQ